MHKLVASVFIASCAFNASAGGLKDLENFLSGTRAGSAAFTQTVTAPSRAGQAAPRTKTSGGRFEFQRPDRFRFEYSRPFEQTIVADGKTLWLFDRDLNQVTQKPQAQALGSAPAALVTSSASLSKLAEVFELSDEPEAQGLSWAKAVPRQADGTLRSVRVGFADGQLAVLEMEDSFGQRSVLKFEGFKANPAFEAGHFNFKPPPGADVLKP
ncbi:LolA family protein [Hydrogenophaga soli]